MPIYNGSKRIGTLSLGSNKIGEAYLGGTCVYRSEIKVVSEEYSTPSVSLSYGTASATATSLSPSYSYRQTKTTTYSDGSTATSTITSGGSLSWSVSNRYSGATFSTSNGRFTLTENTTTSQITLGTVTLTVTLNGKSGSASATAYQAAGSVTTTYEHPIITEFSYPTLGFKEGSTAEPTLKFTQDWSDNAGNSGTLTEETTPFTAEYTAFDPGGEEKVGFSFGENGEVIADHKNTSGVTNQIGNVTVLITANGQTGVGGTSIDQKSRTAGIVDPEVKIDSTIFQDHYGSTTVKLSFNIDTTMNSALSVTPKYFLDTAGNKYDVVEEEIVHDNSSSSGTTTTKYWAVLPYNEEFRNYSFYLWCEFTFATGETSRGYEYTDTDDVQSTNYLILDTSNNYRVWN